MVKPEHKPPRSVLWAGPECGREVALDSPVIIIRRGLGTRGLGVVNAATGAAGMPAGQLPEGVSRYLRSGDLDREGRVIYHWDSPWPRRERSAQ